MFIVMGVNFIDNKLYTMKPPLGCLYICILDESGVSIRLNAHCIFCNSYLKAY